MLWHSSMPVNERDGRTHTHDALTLMTVAYDVERLE
jgi:hypothetical protein